MGLFPAGQAAGPPRSFSSFLVLSHAEEDAAPRAASSLDMFRYLAYSTTLVSRMTWTLICPGYSSSFSIFLARSRARMTI